MTIREAKTQLESENYSGEDLLVLFESYVKNSNESWRKAEEIDKMRIYSLALKQMILELMKK